MTKLTKRAKRIRREYLYINSEFNKYDVQLKIGNQSFNFANYSDSVRSHIFHRKMLAIALDNFLTMESGK